MPYSEKQIAEWAEATWRVLPVFLELDRSIAVETLKGAARTFIAAVRKETREECEKDAERYRYLLQHEARLLIWHFLRYSIAEENKELGHPREKETPRMLARVSEIIDAAIRNLQEREEGKT